MALPLSKSITDAGIIPGIKVDTGAKDLAGHPGEKITEGLDGLRDRLAEYFQMGAAFCQVARGDCHGRWHSQPGLHRGQRAGVGSLRRVVPGSRMVPVVEPEVLMDGEHTLERCREVTEEVLRTVFNQLITRSA